MDGLDFFSTAHVEAKATYTNEHDLALAVGGVWTPFWDGTKDVTMEEVVNSLEDREAHHAAKGCGPHASLRGTGGVQARLGAVHGRYEI